MQTNALQEILAQAYQNLNRRQFATARQLAGQALALQPALADAMMAMGLSWFHENRPAKALPWFSKAVRSKPDNPAIWNALLRAARQSGQAESVLGLIQTVLSPQVFAPSLPTELLVALVETLEQAGAYEQVITWLDRQVNIPDDLSAWVKACRAWNLEMLNRTEEAQSDALECLQRDPQNFRANAVMARLALRRKDPEEALGYLKAIQKPASVTNQAILKNLEGQALEQAGQYKAAFKAYADSNHRLTKVYCEDGNGAHAYSTQAARIMQDVDWQSLSVGQEPGADHSGCLTPPPVFLVGFPRAGTTLLEKMLDAHPDIATVEEKPLIAPVLDYVLQGVTTGRQLTEKLRQTGRTRRKELRQAYMARRRQYLGSETNKYAVIVDKLPLNIIHMGLLAWLFPEARFVMAIRDPRDVALSCFFQLFQPNAAMRNFLDWRQTAKFLKASMEAGLAAQPLCGDRLHCHRYEDFVQDPAREMKQLLAFLGLQWQEEMAGFQKNLIGRSINTPSYQRVTETIDQSRVARWRHYDWALKAVENDLRPLATRLGYRW